MTNIKIKIIYSELRTTDALVNSIRVLFILKTITEAVFQQPRYMLSLFINML